jgi:hypothetical protein
MATEINRTLTLDIEAQVFQAAVLWVQLLISEQVILKLLQELIKQHK